MDLVFVLKWVKSVIGRMHALYIQYLWSEQAFSIFRAAEKDFCRNYSSRNHATYLKLRHSQHFSRHARDTN